PSHYVRLQNRSSVYVRKGVRDVRLFGGGRPPVMSHRTQVGIIGAGPAGLLLSHLLARAGVESVVVEIRSREYCERRQRAGLLEQGTVSLLRDCGLGARLDTEGIEHGGIYLQYGGERHHI